MGFLGGLFTFNQFFDIPIQSGFSCYSQCQMKILKLSKCLTFHYVDFQMRSGAFRVDGEGNGNPLWCTCLGNPMD